MLEKDDRTYPETDLNIQLNYNENFPNDADGFDGVQDVKKVECLNNNIDDKYLTDMFGCDLNTLDDMHKAYNDYEEEIKEMSKRANELLSEFKDKHRGLANPEIPVDKRDEMLLNHVIEDERVMKLGFSTASDFYLRVKRWIKYLLSNKGILEESEENEFTDEDRKEEESKFKSELIKGRKAHMYSLELNEYEIAQFMLYYENIRMISFKRSLDRGGALLAFYVDNPKSSKYGTYESGVEGFGKLIHERYKCSADEKFRDRVLYFLMLKAPVTHCNTNPDLIWVKNGIVDYRTKKLSSFSPDFVRLSKIGVDYRENIKSPSIVMPDGAVWTFDAWLNSISDNKEIVKLLYQVISAAVRPFVPWCKCLLFSGNGNNGKGTLCDLIRNIVGDDNWCSIQISEFGKDFALTELIHSTVVIADENDTDSFSKNLSKFKAVVTGDPIKMDRKFLSDITYTFNGLVIQCINEFPKVRDLTDSLFRRLIIIPFDKCFTGTERRYIKEDYLNRKEVLEYVLYQAINTDFYSFSEPDVCRAILGQYKTYVDSIREFWDELSPEFAWSFYPNEFLYDLYKEWHKKNCPNEGEVPKSTFLKRLKAILKEDEHWKSTDESGPISTSTIANQHLMDVAELLIVEYGLNDWINPTYKGNDRQKLSMPVLTKTSYRGFRHIV